MPLNEGMPTRSFMDDPDIKWRGTPPDYTATNEKYLRERTRNHKEGSLEKIVENLVKTWEMEVVHKDDIDQWQTIEDRDIFFVQVNGGPKLSADELNKNGTYAGLLQMSPFYNVHDYNIDESNGLFKTAFPGKFPWEILDVYSGPPKVSFKWRHWADFTGPYQDIEPTGERVELIGTGVAMVSANLKFESIELYFDPNPLMMQLKGIKKCPVLGKADTI